MYELLKTSFWTYMFVTAFVGLGIVLFCFGVIKKTKRIESRRAKAALRIVVCCILGCFWAYFFVYLNLYPVSLAYYEYNNDLKEEATGVIDNIEREGKDRIHLIIDDTKYTMVYSSISSFAGIDGDIDEGDIVCFSFGKESNYIFDICELN